MTQTESAKQFDFDHAIQDEDIERAKLLLGLDAPTSIDEFYRQATPDGIRNFARGSAMTTRCSSTPPMALTPGGVVRLRRR